MNKKWYYCIVIILQENREGVEFDEKETKLLKTYNLITNKPFIYLANVSEEELLNDGNEYVNKVREIASREKSSVVMMCAKIESELSELDEESKKEFLQDLGIQNSGLDQYNTRLDILNKIRQAH